MYNENLKKNLYSQNATISLNLIFSINCGDPSEGSSGLRGGGRGGGGGARKTARQLYSSIRDRNLCFLGPTRTQPVLWPFTAFSFWNPFPEFVACEVLWSLPRKLSSPINTHYSSSSQNSGSCESQTIFI